MTHESTYTTLAEANEFLTENGFAPLTREITNYNNRFLGYNKKGQMMMARYYANWGRVGNAVIHVKIVD